MKTYNWRPFLERWSADWAGSPGARADSEPEPEPDALGERWLGFAGAGPERIGALEERLGPDVVLPPTFRSFLAVTDGWRPAGTGLRLLGTVEGTRWYGGPDGRRGALRLAVEGDGTEVLLDPGEVTADGEWAAYLHRSGSGDAPDRYESFMDLMQALFRSFHRGNRDTPGFENDTTRELDAEVEEARRACLRGESVDGSLKVFTEAEECGRPRARVLRVQLEALLGGGRARDHLAGRMDDPLYARELAPLYAVREGLRPERDEEDFVGEHTAGDRERVRKVLRATVGRTFRYEAPGPFGAAVDAAREQARWGDTEAAWDTLAAAVADWEPYGDEHLAPVGLLADPLLGPVITPERGRYLLETPRGTAGREPGSGSVPGAGASTGEGATSWDDGLAWLADEPAPGTERDGGYRFVFVRGVAPEELAARIGRGPLLAPGTEDEVATAVSAPERGGRRPVARVGSCGDGWSFAYESRPHLSEAFAPDRLTGLGESASAGGESVTVWCERGGGPAGSPGAFHFSYAEDGARVYGFTVRGEEIESWGELPDTLDPEELFPAYEDEAGDGEEFGGASDGGFEEDARPGNDGAGLDPDDEYEALDALFDEFGISLPEFALRHGRLHAVLPRPWTRPPGPGEQPYGDGPRQEPS
ncbi:SMI1/KNR4 family protein [Streptomyces sp. NPDC088124]|uniref:SMI1/KNR4 family protein n=1 Tax=Streptomyces sp. NPDC088124 TaxID=3154654 RepID=UPI00342FA54D